MRSIHTPLEKPSWTVCRHRKPAGTDSYQKKSLNSEPVERVESSKPALVPVALKVLFGFSDFPGFPTMFIFF